FLRPVNVLQTDPQRELVKRETDPDAKRDCDDVPPRGPERHREGQETGKHHQADAPHQMMDVHAAPLNPPRPPANPPRQPRAGSNRKKRNQERGKYQERRPRPRPRTMAEQIDADERGDQHRDVGYFAAEASAGCRASARSTMCRVASVSGRLLAWHVTE